MVKNIGDLQDQFQDLITKHPSHHLDFFLKSFIFALGPEWKQVSKLASQFQQYCRDGGECSGSGDGVSNDCLNAVQASDFLQKYGITRTASQRISEIRDIDLNCDQRISLIEYLLLHYKGMILREYFLRTKEPHGIIDFEGGAVGLVGVGALLLNELFEIPAGLDPITEKAIEDFTAQKRVMEARVASLNQLALQNGVRGLTAKNELLQLQQQDQTAINRLEVTLAAAQRRSSKVDAKVALEKVREVEALAEKKRIQMGRDSLRQRAAIFHNKGN